MRKQITFAIYLTFLSILVKGQCIINTNLLVNGDFEDDVIDFTSDYEHSLENINSEGSFDIVNNSNLLLSNFAYCTDPSSVEGNMMVVHGRGAYGDKVWCQNVSVEQDEDYSFSANVMSIYSVNSASLQFSINGEVQGSPYDASNANCTWSQFCETWNSGLSTSAEICIVNQNSNASGNNFAIDDIKMGKSVGLFSVDFDDLELSSEKGTIKISWIAYKEIEHDEYIIERSADGEDWSYIGSYKGTLDYESSKEYIFYDHLPISGTYYYRLKIVSSYGEFEYSDVKIIKHEVVTKNIKVYPNPMIDKVYININEKEEIKDLMLLDQMGKVLFHEKKTDEIACISLPNLNPGSYFIQFKTKEDEFHRTVIVKQ